MRRLLIVLVALGTLGAAIGAWFHLARDTAPMSAEEVVRRGAAALRAHDATRARDLAAAAVRDAPNSAATHLLLAKSMLALDDGVGAEAELKRAVETGADAKLLAHLRAHAFLLQGDGTKALSEAANAVATGRPYGLRISARVLADRGEWTAAGDLFDQALRLAPRDPDLWLDTARFRLAAGDVLGANAAAQRVLQLDSNHVAGLLVRGELVRAQYGLVAALPWFEAALKHDPRDYSTLVEYAATLGDAGRTVDALAATRRVLVVRPNSPQALYLQSVIAARAGDRELASTLLAKSDGAIDALPAALLLKSILDVQSGDYEQAITRLKALIDRQPLNTAARKLLAAAMLRRDSALEALNVLQPLTGRNKTDSYALLLAARGLERRGDRDGAAALIDRSGAASASVAGGAFSEDDSLGTLAAQADQHPDDPAALVAYVRGLYGSGDTATALSKAEQVASRNRAIPAAQLLLGDMLMLANRPTDAALVYGRAADIRFDSPTLLRLVEALERAGRSRDAANALDLYLSQNPLSLSALRISGHSQLMAGRYEVAINSLEQLRAQLGDGDAALNADLALAYAEAGALDDALEFGEAAYALAPANPLVVEAFGWVLYRAGDFAHAAELTRKALRLAPGAPELRWQLAQINAAGDRRKAAGPKQAH
ncbi:tetratricopeptide repeat protein [Sphingomonas xinjiangensis]|uniref:Tetratricopeptide (TPR) repeat protein n=1 Tax=Sphingomonas xinjiangensis TaxID=643568 RepID=A0A840YPZ7_9SPHN|nr:tetratricopeptide repeat protein [Sphingomonas xinjiangensis]MBB5710302.1 tetratricopeptide (TPR) repeat protein [Sphingomonas xinjiangensis]